MFGKIAAFELRYQLKNPVFWVAAVAFFLLTFATVTLDNVHIGDTANAHLNGPYAIIETHLIWSLFYMFVSTAFVANVVVRDDETGFGALMKSTPVSKFAYLYGRFTGAFLAGVLAFLAVPLAIWIGSMMPWLDPAKLGPFRPMDYLFAFGVMALPNLFLTSAGFFALATVTRSMMATYVGLVGVLVLYTIATTLGGKLEYAVPMAYLDPFGFGAFELAARYWTATDRNGTLPALAGPLLANRLLWTAIGAGLLAAAYGLFRFEVRGSKSKKAVAQADVEIARPVLGAALASRTFGPSAAWAQLIARARMDFGLVFKSPAFAVLLILGLANAAGGLLLMDGQYGVVVYPATRLMIATLQGSFTFVPLIVAIYYAGELVWRERVGAVAVGDHLEQFGGAALVVLGVADVVVGGEFVFGVLVRIAVGGVAVAHPGVGAGAALAVGVVQFGRVEIGLVDFGDAGGRAGHGCNLVGGEFSEPPDPSGKRCANATPGRSVRASNSLGRRLPTIMVQGWTRAIPTGNRGSGRSPSRP